MRVRLARDVDSRAWNEYISTRATHHAHRFEWRDIISSTFHHEPLYLLAEDAASLPARISGVLPLFFVKSILFGRALVSVPYLNGGGVISDSPIATSALVDEATRLAGDYHAAYVELRHRESYHHDELTLRSHKVAMLLPLDRDPEKLMKSFPAKLRSQIRRPGKEGLTSEIGSIGDERLVRAFFTVFAENMRDLGTPVYPSSLFEKTLTAFGSEARVCIVWDGQVAAAAGITLGTNNYVEIPWASSLRRYNNVSANMLLYWELIRDACVSGAEYFDFGRSSPDAGTFRFKKQWGAEPLPLHWYYHVRTGSVPDVNPNSRKFDLVVRTWRRLPLGVTNRIGPWLTRSLP